MRHDAFLDRRAWMARRRSSRDHESALAQGRDSGRAVLRVLFRGAVGDDACAHCGRGGTS